MAFTKGTAPRTVKYATGGPEVTTRSRFLKTADAFRYDTEPTDYDKAGKGGTMSKLAGDSKSEKPVKPRK